HVSFTGRSRPSSARQITTKSPDGPSVSHGGRYFEAARRATLSGRHTSGPGQATSATRRHGRIGHEQIFVAKTRLRTLCTQAALRIRAGPSNPPAKVCQL